MNARLLPDDFTGSRASVVCARRIARQLTESLDLNKRWCDTLEEYNHGVTCLAPSALNKSRADKVNKQV